MAITQWCLLGNTEVNKIPNVILFKTQRDIDREFR